LINLAPSANTEDNNIVTAGTINGETPQKPESYFDVALFKYKVRGMGRTDIYDLIKNVFRPDKHYCFPKSKTTGMSG
jgi:hypothetical protein